MATGGSEDKELTMTESLGLGMRFVISTITATFPSVKHVGTPDLAKWLQSDDIEVILLDCRDPREYEVSHLALAIRVDWKTEDILKLLELVAEREGPKNKTIVCYCSLGYRSSSVAQKIQKFNSKTGYGIMCVLMVAWGWASLILSVENPVKQLEVYNLAGSLFKWANEGRPLLDSDGNKTVMAHPYTAMWGKLLNSELRKW